jgi:hypothetical protein
MPPILTAEDVVRRIAAECTYVEASAMKLIVSDALR